MTAPFLDSAEWYKNTYGWQRFASQILELAHLVQDWQADRMARKPFRAQWLERYKEILRYHRHLKKEMEREEERYQAIIRRLAEMQVKMEQAEAAIKRGALVMTAEEWDEKGRAQLRLSIEKVRAKQAAKASG